MPVNSDTHHFQPLVDQVQRPRLLAKHEVPLLLVTYQLIADADDGSTGMRGTVVLLMTGYYPQHVTHSARLASSSRIRHGENTMQMSSASTVLVHHAVERLESVPVPCSVRHHCGQEHRFVRVASPF